MPNTFLTADTHFGHTKTCTVFKRKDGSPLRPFRDGDEMNDEMIKRWNAVVSPNDKVYVLGDVVIRREYLRVLDSLNGKKRLVRGNHDILHIEEYLAYFDEVYGCRVLEGMILTHIPIHPGSLGRYGTNVHGHLHAHDIDDPRYLCVSVEHVDYTPIDLDEVRKRIKAKQERFNYKPDDHNNERSVS